MAKLIILDEALMGKEVGDLLAVGRAHFSALLDTIADTLEMDRFAHALKEEFIGDADSDVLVGPYAAAERGDIAENLGEKLSDAFGICADHPSMKVAAVDVISALPEANDTIDENFKDFITTLAMQVDLYHRGSHRGDEAHVVCAVAEHDAALVERSYHALSGFSDIEFKSRCRLGIDAPAKRDKALEAFPLRYRVERFEDVIYVGLYDQIARRMEGFGATVIAVNSLTQNFKPALRAVLDALYDDNYVYKNTMASGLRL